MGEEERRRGGDIRPWVPPRIWREIDRAIEDVRSQIQALFGGREPGITRFEEMREPYLDLIDSGDYYRVCVELPGIPKENVEVNLTPNSIEISGRAMKEVDEEKEGYVRRERSFARFYRQTSFPEEVRPEEAKATLKNGLLEVRIPKKKPVPAPKKHRISIE